jgi:hypothetical protein
MSEQWPPEWGDPDGEDPASVQSAAAEQLAEVSSALSSMPLPALPDAFAARIGAAIAAEAATRTEHTSVRSLSPDSSAGSFPAAADGDAATAPRDRARPGGAQRATRRPRRSRSSGPAGARPPGRWRDRLLSTPVMGTLLIVVVIAGFGVLFSRIGSVSDSSSSSSALSAPSNSTGQAASGASQPYIGSAAGKGPMAAASSNSGYQVKESGTRYEPATFTRQVRAALAAIRSASPTAQPTTPPGAIVTFSPSSGMHVSAPSSALAGCVARLTGNRTPSLVDRASYAGRPAYIIAVPSRAWVVGLGCTAANIEQITTVPLAG